MMLARLISKIFSKKNGIILIDSEGQKYICGSPNLDNPLTLRLKKKHLNYSLVLNPDLNFPEAYMRGEIEIENGTLLDFLNAIFEQLDGKEINAYGYFFKKITNVDLKIKALSDPIFDFYREAFLDLVVRTPKWVRTINATEGGSLFGKGIKNMKFEEILK